MPAALMSGVVEKSAGDALRVPCDFGDEPALEAGATVVNGVLVMPVNIASFAVTSATLTVTGEQLDYPYQVSAKIAGGTVGTHQVAFEIMLDDPDATIVERVGTVKVVS